jgi:hypothetical protein
MKFEDDDWINSERRRRSKGRQVVDGERAPISAEGASRSAMKE